MTLTIGRFIVEVNLSYIFVKCGRWEMFLSLERDRGPAGRRIIFDSEAPASKAL